jgi:hypothetical protein
MRLLRRLLAAIRAVWRWPQQPPPPALSAPPPPPPVAPLESGTATPSAVTHPRFAAGGSGRQPQHGTHGGFRKSFRGGR